MASKLTLEDTEAVDDKKINEPPTIAEAAVNGKTLTLKEVFLKKKRRVDKQKITLDGEIVEITIEALTQKEFDDMVAAHPKRRNKEEDDLIGANSKTFPPALFSASVKDPKMTQEEWEGIWTSEEWSPGELGHLLNIVLATTSRGFDVPFGGRG